MLHVAIQRSQVPKNGHGSKVPEHVLTSLYLYLCNPSIFRCRPPSRAGCARPSWAPEDSASCTCGKMPRLAARWRWRSASWALTSPWPRGTRRSGVRRWVRETFVNFTSFDAIFQVRRIPVPQIVPKVNIRKQICFPKNFRLSMVVHHMWTLPQNT